MPGVGLTVAGQGRVAVEPSWIDGYECTSRRPAPFLSQIGRRPARLQRIYAAGEVIVDNEVYRFHQHTESMEQVVSLGHDPERNAAGYPGYFTVLVASFDDCWQTKYGQMAYGAHWNTSTPLCAGQATSLPQRLRQR